MSDTIKMLKRFEFTDSRNNGSKRVILEPGLIIELPDKIHGLNSSTLDRLLARKAGVKNPKTETKKEG